MTKGGGDRRRKMESEGHGRCGDTGIGADQQGPGLSAVINVEKYKQNKRKTMFFFGTQNSAEGSNLIFSQQS